LAELDLPTPAYTTGWWTFSAAICTIPSSVETSRARKASWPSSYRAQLSIGSAAYTVTAGDLRPLNHDNVFITFADDTYLVISAANNSTRAAEIDNIAAWAAKSNRKLNKSKPSEVLFRDKR